MGLMDNVVPERYEKQPMLAVIENFVLDAIGVLEKEKVEQLGPIVCRIWGGTDWRRTVREKLGLPEDSAKQLQAMWKQRVEEAEATQTELTPEEFSRDVADDLIADMGG